MIWLAVIGLALLGFYSGYLILKSFQFRQLKEVQPNESYPQLSVIIPARNEEKNLQACLKALSAQSYPLELVEFIVVDDHSEDGTAEIAKRFVEQDERFRYLKLGDVDGIAYKKAALALGIQNASGKIIVTTDADCQSGPDWLKTMVGTFTETTGMVSGPVLLSGDTPFAEMQALEFLGLITVGAASIQAGNPTMCNGANLAFRKEVFQAVGGYDDIRDIASGDDELLMHKIVATGKWEVKFAKSNAAVVTTPAQPDLNAFARQRRRWVSKSRKYDNKGITAILAVSWLSMWVFPISLILGFFQPLFWLAFICAFVFKMLAEAFVLVEGVRFFGKEKWLKWLPVLVLPHVLYILWAGIAGNLGGYEWKGRNVK